MKQNDKINLILRRFDEIEESINLGTLDTAILGLMIFVFTIAISILSLGFPNSILNKPYLLIGVLFFFIFAIPLIQYIFSYVQTIAFKKGRFTYKKRIITFLAGELIFIIEMWLFLIIAWIYERWWPTPSILIYIIFIDLLVLAIVITYFYISPNVNRYFEQNFPLLINRRLEEIKKE